MQYWSDTSVTEHWPLLIPNKSGRDTLIRLLDTRLSKRVCFFTNCTGSLLYKLIRYISPYIFLCCLIRLIIDNALESLRDETSKTLTINVRHASSYVIVVQCTLSFFLSKEAVIQMYIYIGNYLCKYIIYTWSSYMYICSHKVSLSPSGVLFLHYFNAWTWL